MERGGRVPIVGHVAIRVHRIQSAVLRAGRAAEDALPVGLGLVVAILFLAAAAPSVPGGLIGRLVVVGVMLLLVVRQTIVLRQRDRALIDAREQHHDAQQALAENRRLSAELEARIVAIREVETKLIDASRQKAVADLATQVAHEVNNPLTAVLGYAELLLAEVPPDGRGREELTTIRDEAIRARDIVRRLLELAHGAR